ncbi:MAG: hypothetical protein QOH63_1992 [Acidobacteriota bacterium]|jgi:hypothetical protein|nr:hypothetical protein [Acidobacteriota bacterium]
MPDQSYKKLLYRGNFEVVCEIDFSESLLSARYAGGYHETAVIGSPNGLRTWRLKYTALHKNVLLNFPGSEPMSREEYIWQFFCNSKGSGNLPFILTCPRDSKDYLGIFKEDALSFTLIDQFLRTTGLTIEQCFVRGTNTLSDGSLGDSSNPDQI